ncbi:MAG: hypothetical protein OEV08_11415, partial [Nitrospira sp.]|nr:hypothetical protein [Nitrospira sp.]
MTGLVVLVHLAGLPLMFALTCSHGVAQERMFQTFDFWRTTRLMPHELIVGQLFGLPLRGLLAVACTLPVVVAMMAFVVHVSLVDLALVYLMLILFSSVVGLGALIVSMSMNFQRGERGLMWLLLLPIVFFGLAVLGGFPGFLVMTPYHYVGDIGRGTEDAALFLGETTTLFGRIVLPSLFVGIGLNLSFGGWFALMLHRNIKRDFEEIRLLSRWQAVGFAVFLNVLFYALWKPSDSLGMQMPSAAQAVFLLNALVLYGIGVMMLTPPERLRVWWRSWMDGRSSYLAEDGLPWPWVMLLAGLVTGMAYVAATVANWLLDGWIVPLGIVTVFLDRWIVPFGIVTVFIVRDVMFLQWCLCQGFKRPLMTGLLYIGLYYFVMQALVSSKNAGFFLPPFHVVNEPVFSVAVGAVIVQGAIAGLLVWLVLSYLKQPARTVASPSVKTAVVS